MCVTRRIVPKDVRRGSSDWAITGPVPLSALLHMVRNFNTLKVLPSCPTRGWRKNTGPRLSNLIKRIVSTQSGEATQSPTPLTSTSIVRFRKAAYGGMWKPWPKIR